MWHALYDTKYLMLRGRGCILPSSTCSEYRSVSPDPFALSSARRAPKHREHLPMVGVAAPNVQRHRRRSRPGDARGRKVHCAPAAALDEYAGCLARGPPIRVLGEPVLLVRLRDRGDDAARLARRDAACGSGALSSGTHFLGGPDAVSDRPHEHWLGVPGAEMDCALK